MDKAKLDLELLAICDELMAIADLAIERASRVIRDRAWKLERRVSKLANKLYHEKDKT
jgi:hypothetical protein